MRRAELDSRGRPYLEGDVWTKTFEWSSTALSGKQLCRENGLQRPWDGSMPGVLKELWEGHFGWKKWRRGRIIGNEDRKVMGTRCRPCRSFFFFLALQILYFTQSRGLLESLIRGVLRSTLCSRRLPFILVLWTDRGVGRMGSGDT